MLETPRTHLQAGRALESPTMSAPDPNRRISSYCAPPPLQRTGTLLPEAKHPHPHILTYLVEFPEVLFLSLVNDSENTGDGFANNSATKTETPLKTHSTFQRSHSGPDPDLIGQEYSPPAHSYSPRRHLTQAGKKVFWE